MFIELWADIDYNVFLEEMVELLVLMVKETLIFLGMFITLHYYYIIIEMRDEQKEGTASGSLEFIII